MKHHPPIRDHWLIKPPVYHISIYVVGSIVYEYILCIASLQAMIRSKPMGKKILVVSPHSTLNSCKLTEDMATLNSTCKVRCCCVISFDFFPCKTMLKEFTLNMFELCCHDKACLWQQRHVPLGPRRGQQGKGSFRKNFVPLNQILLCTWKDMRETTFCKARNSD